MRKARDSSLLRCLVLRPHSRSRRCTTVEVMRRPMCACLAVSVALHRLSSDGEHAGRYLSRVQPSYLCSWGRRPGVRRFFAPDRTWPNDATNPLKFIGRGRADHLAQIEAVLAKRRRLRIPRRKGSGHSHLQPEPRPPIGIDRSCPSVVSSDLGVRTPYWVEECSIEFKHGERGGGPDGTVGAKVCAPWV